MLRPGSGGRRWAKLERLSADGRRVQRVDASREALLEPGRTFTRRRLAAPPRMEKLRCFEPKSRKARAAGRALSQCGGLEHPSEEKTSVVASEGGGALSHQTLFGETKRGGPGTRATSSEAPEPTSASLEIGGKRDGRKERREGLLGEVRSKRPVGVHLERPRERSCCFLKHLFCVFCFGLPANIAPRSRPGPSPF